jgi:hypothetical protein
MGWVYKGLLTYNTTLNRNFVAHIPVNTRKLDLISPWAYLANKMKGNKPKIFSSFKIQFLSESRSVKIT